MRHALAVLTLILIPSLVPASAAEVIRYASPEQAFADALAKELRSPPP